ncbi:unnamed protein product [Urochloa humidicola]
MAIPVARVHLAMAHAALPGLLPSPPKCTMFPLLPSPPCAAIILPINSSPPRPTRADAAGRWDAHKIKQGGGSPSSSSSSGGHHSLDSSNKIVTLTSSASSRSSSRADSEERWDAHKRPASSSSSSSASSSSNRTKTCHVSRRPAKKGGRAAASSSAERWDAQKKARALAAGDELDDGVSSNGSNGVEMDMPRQPPRSLYAGPGFIASSPEPSMLPMPSLMILVK